MGGKPGKGFKANTEKKTGFPPEAENPFTQGLVFVVFFGGYRLKLQFHLGTLGPVG